MCAALFLALFAHSIFKNEIQCALIGRENLNGNGRNSADLAQNLATLKEMENVKIEKTPFLITNKKKPVSISDNESIDPKSSPLKDENQIVISKANDGGRQPKFFGSLAFLAGLGAGGLATAASDNVNTFVNLLHGSVPLPFGYSRYFTGFYGPPPYLPVSYPVLYPVPSIASNYQNFPSGIPALPPSLPVPSSAPIRQNTANNTTGISRQSSDTNLGGNEPDDEMAQGSKAAEATQTESKRTVAPEMNDDIVENVVSPVVSGKTEFRQFFGAPETTTTTTTTTTPKPTSTTSTKPTMLNTTEESNGTVPSTSPANTSEQSPFYGYYGGSPQAVNNVMFTTEHPQQRYLKDYNADAFPLPSERPAVFNPYQNVDTYPSPFVNSFSSGEPYPEFLNSVESDRYRYNSENHRNYNGFRPISK